MMNDKLGFLEMNEDELTMVTGGVSSDYVMQGSLLVLKRPMLLMELCMEIGKDAEMLLRSNPSLLPYEKSQEKIPGGTTVRIK